MDPVRDLITNLRRMLVAKFFNFLHDEDQETPWSQNPTVYKIQQLLQEKDELGLILSSVTICINKTWLHTCATVQPLTTLKIILIYV